MTFNKFDDVYLLTGGGAGTDVVSVRVYDFLTAATTWAPRRPRPSCWPSSSMVLLGGLLQVLRARRQEEA